VIDTHYYKNDKRGIRDVAVIFNFRRVDELRVLKLSSPSGLYYLGKYQLKIKDCANHDNLYIQTKGNCILITDISPTNLIDYFKGLHFERERNAFSNILNIAP